MTEIIIKKRKTLSLKRPDIKVEEVKETPSLSPQELNALSVAEAKKEADRQYIACREWMILNWPELFNSDNPKPLAKGIINAIKRVYIEQGGVENLGFYGNTPLKKFLSAWTRRKAYQKAMVADGAYRYGLTNDPVELVNEDDKAHALANLEEFKRKNARKKANKKGKSNHDSDGN